MCPLLGQIKKSANRKEESNRKHRERWKYDIKMDHKNLGGM